MERIIRMDGKAHHAGEYDHHQSGEMVEPDLDLWRKPTDKRVHIELRMVAKADLRTQHQHIDHATAGQLFKPADVELEKISIQYLTKHSQDHNSEKDGDEHPFHPVDRFDNFHRSQPFLLSGSARETEVIRFPGAEKRRKMLISLR